ncbi:MAG TPA: acyl-CoA dehydrogenase family protein [Solirubrobacterales bacterium]|nr:acyl-CoA dehydrogenase family protein [Solirubrobacterales bacterium]
MLALPFDPEHGGTGTGSLMLGVAIEEIAKVCASSAPGSKPSASLGTTKALVRRFSRSVVAKTT